MRMLIGTRTQYVLAALAHAVLYFPTTFAILSSVSALSARWIFVGVNGNFLPFVILTFFFFFYICVDIHTKVSQRTWTTAILPC